MFSFSLNAFCKNPPISVGGWRTHTAYNKAVDITEDGNGNVICAAQYGLFSYNKSSGEIEIFSRLTGLSDFEISNVQYDLSTHVLLISYVNSNIDLIFPDHSIVNIPDIKEKDLVGGKKINAITFINGNAYLSTEFGIVVLNVLRKEVSDTWFIGTNGSYLNVNGLAYDGTDVVAATDSGLYRATLTDPNIFDYHSWTRQVNLAQPITKYTSTTAVNGTLFTVKEFSTNSDSLLILQNNYWSPFTNSQYYGGNVSTSNNNLIFSVFDNVYAFDLAGNVLENGYGYIDGRFPGFRDAIRDTDGNLWMADYNNGLIKKHAGVYTVVIPNGPASEAVYDMQSKKGNLWVASGALDGTSPDYSSHNGIYYFNDNNWKSFGCRNDSIYGVLCNLSPAVIAAAIDPNDAAHAYIASWGSGLLEYTANGGVARFTDQNSTIKSHNLIPNYFLVGAVNFDPDGNLWAVSSANRNGIACRKADGNWREFTIPDVNIINYGLFKLIVDDLGQKWMIAREGSNVGQGLCVFKEASLDNSTLQNFKRVIDRTNYGGLPDLLVHDIAKDKDGAIWIGTNKGVCVIYNPGNVFSGGSYDAQKPITVLGGYAQYLLESEIVTSVVVDGANRKWFGTYSSGAFLLSSDGTQQLLNFNTANSPLPSNNIISIAVDDKTGEVFFATEKGIVSYRGDATEGGTACSDYYVFPNPVRSDYQGIISITGLVNNADVRITDIAGNIVYHTKANGGQASWLGTNFKGERVQTGIYVVYVTNEDGTEGCVTKMLIGK